MTKPQHRAFLMRLNPGQAAEYKRRHDEIWPELSSALKLAGITDYRIYLDEETHTLFATLTTHDTTAVDRLPEIAIVQRWWAYMADIMQTNCDSSPFVEQLSQMFHLSETDESRE